MPQGAACPARRTDARGTLFFLPGRRRLALAHIVGGCSRQRYCGGAYKAFAFGVCCYSAGWTETEGCALARARWLCPACATAAYALRIAFAFSLKRIKKQKVHHFSIYGA